jgi:two-component system alkaline phosphatase synthesis response regulator PhoP
LQIGQAVDTIVRQPVLYCEFQLSFAQLEVPVIFLVIDDEPTIVSIASSYLRAEGFTVHGADNGEQGLSLFRQIRPDFVILDIMLPGMDGLDLLRCIRQESNAYVIMLTARADEYDRVLGLSIGADDYLVKPFSPRELVARVKSLLRREKLLTVSPRTRLAFESVSIDLDRYEVIVRGEPVDLTAVEFQIFAVLARHSGMVLRRTQIIQHVWGADFYGDERTVDVNIRRLRQKIELDVNAPQIIVTVRGVGYRFTEPSA